MEKNIHIFGVHYVSVHKSVWQVERKCALARTSASQVPMQCIVRKKVHSDGKCCKGIKTFIPYEGPKRCVLVLGTQKRFQ